MSDGGVGGERGDGMEKEWIGREGQVNSMGSAARLNEVQNRMVDWRTDNRGDACSFKKRDKGSKGGWTWHAAAGLKKTVMWLEKKCSSFVFDNRY